MTFTGLPSLPRGDLERLERAKVVVETDDLWHEAIFEAAQAMGARSTNTARLARDAESVRRSSYAYLIIGAGGSFAGFGMTGAGVIDAAAMITSSVAAAVAYPVNEHIAALRMRRQVAKLRERRESLDSEEELEHYYGVRAGLAKPGAARSAAIEALLATPVLARYLRKRPRLQSDRLRRELWAVNVARSIVEEDVKKSALKRALWRPDPQLMSAARTPAPPIAWQTGSRGLDARLRHMLDLFDEQDAFARDLSRSFVPYTPARTAVFDRIKASSLRQVPIAATGMLVAAICALAIGTAPAALAIGTGAALFAGAPGLAALAQITPHSKLIDQEQSEIERHRTTYIKRMQARLYEMHIRMDSLDQRTAAAVNDVLGHPQVAAFVRNHGLHPRPLDPPTRRWLRSVGRLHLEEGVPLESALAEAPLADERGAVLQDEHRRASALGPLHRDDTRIAHALDASHTASGLPGARGSLAD